ncbi:hypothetical protein [Azonexus hydrophilus]
MTLTMQDVAVRQLFQYSWRNEIDGRSCGFGLPYGRATSFCLPHATRRFNAQSVKLLPVNWEKTPSSLTCRVGVVDVGFREVVGLLIEIQVGQHLYAIGVENWPLVAMPVPARNSSGKWDARWSGGMPLLLPAAT